MNKTNSKKNKRDKNTTLLSRANKKKKAKTKILRTNKIL